MPSWFPDAARNPGLKPLLRLSLAPACHEQHGSLPTIIRAGNAERTITVFIEEGQWEANNRRNV